MRIILDNLPITCEFCGEYVVLMVLADHPTLTTAGVTRGDVYVSCPNCLFRLVNCSLAPWQFKRARDAGGDTSRFYLHEDFYGRETGEALQPKLDMFSRELIRREEPR